MGKVVAKERKMNEEKSVKSLGFSAIFALFLVLSR
jgi:hypothetical protein